MPSPLFAFNRHAIAFLSLFTLSLLSVAAIPAHAQTQTASPNPTSSAVTGFPAAISTSANLCGPGQTTPAPCNVIIAITYKIASTTTFGLTKVVTQGTPNLDFTLRSSSCTGTLTTGNFCNVIFEFVPLAPGLRPGAVQLTDSGGDILATTFLSGIGEGPAIAFSPASQTPFANDPRPNGIAVDAAGNVFFHNGELMEIPAAGGPPIAINTALPLSFGLAVDGVGNIFVTSFGNNGPFGTQLSEVVKIPAGGGPQTVLTTDLNSPEGVAVDGAGNVFIADFRNSRVVEIPAGGGPQSTVPITGAINPFGIAVDASDNLFITDVLLNKVVKVPAGGGAQTPIGTGFSSPTGVAVDAAGDVFVADSSHNRIVEIPANGGPQTTIGTGLKNPFCVAVDGNGNAFICDSFNNQIVKVLRSQPPSLEFAATLLGHVSSDSPQSVTVQNIGNQPLKAVAPGLSISPNFLQVPGSGTPPDCTTTFSLNRGASCVADISFNPATFGLIEGTATFTDNVFNATAATQTVHLEGRGGQPPAITSAAGATFTVGKFGSFQVTATGTPAPTFSSCCEMPNGLALNPTTGVISGTPKIPNLEDGNVYILTISADNGVPPRAEQTFTLLLDQAPIFMSDNLTTFTVGVPVSFTVKALGFPPPTFTETGALPNGVHFNSNGSFTGTPAPGTAGTYPITITASNGVLPNATQHFTITVNDFSLDIEPPSRAVTAGNLTLFSIQLASLNGLTGSVSLTCSGLPANSICDFDSNPLQLSGAPGTTRTFLLVFVPQGTTGTFTITITATLGRTVHTAQATLLVQ